MRRAIATLGVVASLAVFAMGARPLHAEENAPSASHRGFHLRAGIGGAGLSGKDTIGADPSGTTSMAAEGVSGEISIGGAVLPGVVVAGTFLGFVFGAPTIEAGGRSTTIDQREQLAIVGLTMDWYPFLRRGFHLLATLGGGWLRGIDRTDSVEARSARYGSSFSLGAGWDFFVAREVSLGILGRLTGAQLGGDERREDGRPVWAESRVGAACVMLTALYQ